MYFVPFVQLMKQVINWGKTIVDADVDADAVAIVDEVVVCCVSLELHEERLPKSISIFLKHSGKLKAGQKTHRSDSVTVSHVKSGRGYFAGRIIYYSEWRANTIYRKSINLL